MLALMETRPPPRGYNQSRVGVVPEPPQMGVCSGGWAAGPLETSGVGRANQSQREGRRLLFPDCQEDREAPTGTWITPERNEGEDGVV